MILFKTLTNKFHKNSHCLHCNRKTISLKNTQLQDDLIELDRPSIANPRKREDVLKLKSIIGKANYNHICPNCKSVFK